MSNVRINVSVNGNVVEHAVEPRLTAVDFLRHELRLTGTHVGCEHGVCGACTVIVEGRAVRGCLLFAAQLDGKQVVTVEGLSQEDGELSPLQDAFHRHHALQCGFCTPGMLTTAHAFLLEEPAPTADRVREIISGNICRCTGYVGIVEAILEASVHYRKPT
jgi:aerobic-type carbon monoxide dehydrogenase small subunit (CoxS/CutS family)